MLYIMIIYDGAGLTHAAFTDEGPLEQDKHSSMINQQFRQKIHKALGFRYTVKKMDTDSHNFVASKYLIFRTAFSAVLFRYLPTLRKASHLP